MVDTNDFDAINYNNVQIGLNTINYNNLQIGLNTLVLLKNGKPKALVIPVFGKYTVHNSKGKRTVGYTYYTDVLTGINYMRYGDYRKIILGDPKNRVPENIRFYTFLSGFTVDLILPYFTNNDIKELADGGLTVESKKRIIFMFFGESEKKRVRG